MSKKIRPRKRGLSQVRSRRHRTAPAVNASTLERDVLAAVTRAGRPVSVDDLQTMLGLPAASLATLGLSLDELARQLKLDPSLKAQLERQLAQMQPSQQA